MNIWKCIVFHEAKEKHVIELAVRKDAATELNTLQLIQ